MRTHSKSWMSVLGLAACVAVSATASPAAAAPISNAAALRAAVPNDITQVRLRSHRGWRRAYGYRSFGRAYGYSRGRVNHFDCLGGRDSSGVPC
jgi:hypothetical protein